LPVTTFTHYFMAGIVNDTTSNSILSWRNRNERNTYAQEKLSRFVTWPTVWLLIIIVLGRNAAKFFFPYQSMAWTVALPPSQLQLTNREINVTRFIKENIHTWYQRHQPEKSHISLCVLERTAQPTQIRVRNFESTRLWSCFKPDLASCSGINTDYKWRQHGEITSPVLLNISSTGSDEITKGTSAPIASRTASKLRYSWKKS